MTAGGDASPVVRQAVVRAMIGAHAASVDPGPWLEDSDRLVRLAAAEAIFWLDPTNRGRMVPTLRAMIVAADPTRPIEVHRPLGLMLQVDRPACGTLCRPSAPGSAMRIRGSGYLPCGCLVELGPMARDVIPALESLMNNSRPAERSHAALAIIVIDPAACDRAAANLLALLGDAAISPAERIQALGPLGMVINHTRVPTRIRDEALKIIRAVPAAPGTHPVFGLRIQQFLDYQDSARAVRRRERRPGHPHPVGPDAGRPRSIIDSEPGGS